jgi:hypothetical protein
MRNASHAAVQKANRFVSAFDRKRLHEIAAQELAACDAGDLREALRLSEAYEQAEANALGLKPKRTSRDRGRARSPG